jgi:predicted nuclease with TOPRIM domain
VHKDNYRSFVAVREVLTLPKGSKMSDTPIQVTTELNKALEQINQKLDKIDLKFETKLDKIDERLNRLEIGQARLEEKFSGQIDALGEKVDGLSKRVDSVDFINRGVFVALIIAILGGFAKIFGFIGNNP